MNRRTVPLDAEAVDDLPARCRRCLFWELGTSRPVDDPDASSEHDARVRKQAWVTTRSLEDGPPGAIVRSGDVTGGYALFAPHRAFTARAAPVPAVDEDALWLATLWVHPDERGVGVGRLLVQAALREAIARDLAAVEVHGDRRARDGDCVVPVTWLLHEGFEVVREHPRYPVLRLDVRRTARWVTSLEHAAQELLGRVPRPVTAPARRVANVDTDLT